MTDAAAAADPAGVVQALDEHEHHGGRVTTLERFFDLVFVFTITQLTRVLTHEPTWRGVALPARPSCWASSGGPTTASPG